MLKPSSTSSETHTSRHTPYLLQSKEKDNQQNRLTARGRWYNISKQQRESHISQLLLYFHLLYQGERSLNSGGLNKCSLEGIEV